MPTSTLTPVHRAAPFERWLAAQGAPPRALTPRHIGATLHGNTAAPEDPRMPEYETLTEASLTPAELTEALESWARAAGGRETRAIVHLILRAGLPETWPEMSQHLAVQKYTDPSDPDPTPYLIARVLNWSQVHNAMPVAAVGKAALSLFVYARAIGDRGFLVSLNDLFGGMEPGTMRVVHEANAIRFGQPVEHPWDRKSK